MSRQRNAAALDLYLLPVARLAGVEDESLLSLHASEPPRRPARGRERDRLILYLSIQGNAPLSATKQAQILANLAHLYYQTPGSVTTALRTVADELNRLLWERNTALAGSNRQGLGVLTQLALRGNQVTLAIGGAAHAYHLTSERVSLLADPELGERALGQSRQTPLRLFQLTLRSGDILLLHSGIPKSGQLPLLANLHGLGPESLRRKLFPPSLNEANAVIVAVRAGEGRIHLPHSKIVPYLPLPAQTECFPAPLVALYQEIPGESCGGHLARRTRCRTRANLPAPGGECYRSRYLTIR